MVPIPHDRAALTLPWLRAAMGTEDVLGLEVTPLGDGGGVAMTSTVWRIILRGAGPGLPGSMVVKILDPGFSRSPDLFQRELRFYQDIAPHFGADGTLPRFYGGRVDPDVPAGFLLLEDLTGWTHPFYGYGPDEAALVLRALAPLHGRHWEAPADGWPARVHSPSRGARLGALCVERWPVLLREAVYPTPPALLDRIDELLAALPEALARLRAAPRTLIHGDLHVENLFPARRGRAGAAAVRLAERQPRPHRLRAGPGHRRQPRAGAGRGAGRRACCGCTRAPSTRRGCAVPWRRCGRRIGRAWCGWPPAP